MEDSEQPGSIASAAIQAGQQLVQSLLAASNATGGSTEAPSAPFAHLNQDQPTLAPAAHRNAQVINDLPCFKDLIAVLIECFTIISLGYLSSRFKLISADAKDLGAYLTTLALPMIIFLNIARMEFQTINMSFLFCMLISKLFLFILVTLITLAISYPANFSYAGALSILATQSNDFALGYPLINSLYGESRPEMLSYLNLMGPIQLLIINPLGIIMLEYEKSRNNRRRRRICLHCSKPSSSRSSPQAHSESRRAIKTDERHIGDHPAPGGSQTVLARQTRLVTIESTQTSSSLINLADKENATARAGLEERSARSLNDGSRIIEAADRQPMTSRQPQQRQQKMPLTMSGSGMNRQNIKSLTLVMPATMMLKRSRSQDSIGRSSSARTLDGKLMPLVVGSHKKTLDSPQVEIRDDGNSAPVELAVPAAGRPVYTRPKWFNLIENSKWRSQMGHSSANGTANNQNDRRQTNSCADATTQLQNDFTEDPDQRLRCACRGIGANNDDDGDPLTSSEPGIDLSFIRALLTNPLIIASIVALMVNLINGPELPKFVTKVCNTIAASFAAPALFVVGLSMYGKFNLIARNPNDFLLSSVLVATKVLILPSIMRTVVLLILPNYAESQEVPYLADFSYLYGLLPTAPGACIIAKQYEVLTNVVSICMLLSTLISAPLMLATSAVINQASSIGPENMFSIVVQTLRASSGVTLVFSLLTVCLLWKANRKISYRNFINSIECALDGAIRAKATQLLTFLLAMTQLVVGTAGVMWLFLDTGKLNPANTDGAESSHEAWRGSQHNDDDLLASEVRRTLHTRILSPGPGGFLVAQQAPSRDPLAGSHVLCTIQFILSSGGLIMTRFIILCIILIKFAKRYEGHRFGSLLWPVLTKVSLLVVVCVILNLAFESQHSNCSPSEPSLPTRPVSIYLRLIFNVTLLCIAIPLFTATFRLENRTSWFKAEEGPGDIEPAALRHQRRFKQSSASLTSETSSAITTSTNLDTLLSLNHGPSSVRDTANIRRLDQMAKQQSSEVVVLDDSIASADRKDLELSRCDVGKPTQLHLEQQASRGLLDRNLNESDEHEHEHEHDEDEDEIEHHHQRTQIGLDNSRPLYGANNPATTNNWRYQLKRNITHTIDNPHYAISGLEESLTYLTRANGQNRELTRADGPAKSHHRTSNKTVSYEDQAQSEVDLTNLVGEQHPENQQQLQQWQPATSPAYLDRSEFDMHSILIAFMLFQAFLSVSSLVQQLNQTSPYGTFMLIEMANVALDYGQGIVTFLVTGLPMLSLKSTISTSAGYVFRDNKQQPDRAGRSTA